MGSFSSICSLILLYGFLKYSEAFNYKNPEKWGDDDPACNGDAQSPVDILARNGLYWMVPDKAIYHENDEETPDKMTIVNDGNTVKGIVRYNKKKWQYRIRNGPLEREKYYLDHFTLHWGASDDSGTEHIIDGKRYALEIQIVFCNEKYDSYEEAAENDHGLVIFAGLYSVDGDDYEEDDTEEIHQLWKAFDEPLKVGDERIIEPFSLGYLRISDHWRPTAVYNGSLTTPPCTENVIWVVCSSHFGITPEMMAKLRKNVQLRDGDDHNNRPIQSLNGRKEYYMGSS